ncbi:MAG TPA: bifunctional oligoribonuclease/PAP phosphatase NrnA [Spirochaetia bacterium]|nr:bifunctional oligoribonuclease/PAP phosphatase NrnA [Spirochaetia bacterium]
MISDAADFLRKHGSFLVLGHKEPDGDCIASQLAVAVLVTAMGKSAGLYSVGPFDRPEIEEFAERFSSVIPREKPAGAAAIIVDCSTPDRTGTLGPAVEGLPALIIDHHSAGTDFGTVRLVDSQVPSTTLLIFPLFEALGIPVDVETGRLLLFGLCTDTGFFRHLGSNSPATFEALSRLTRLGVTPADVYMMIYGRRDLSARKLLGELLARVEGMWNDRLLITWQTIEDRRRNDARQRGEDDLYRLLQTVRGTVVVAFIKEEHPGHYSVGLRSNSSLDVGVIAASFGGGGHRQAAGFDISGTLESIKKILIATFAPLLG